MKEVSDGFISRLGTARERISNLYDMSIETSQIEMQGEKNNEEKAHNSIPKNCEIISKGIILTILCFIGHS